MGRGVHTEIGERVFWVTLFYILCAVYPSQQRNVIGEQSDTAYTSESIFLSYHAVLHTIVFYDFENTPNKIRNTSS